MGFAYDFQYGVPHMEAGFGDALGIVLAIYGLFLLAMFAFAVTSYVLHSIGLYSLAKRRGIRHPWLAWIPVGNMWLLGSISDQYQYVVKGLVRNRRKTLLVITLLIFLLSAVLSLSCFGTFFDAITGEASDALAGTVGVVLVGLLIAVLDLIGVIVQYIAYHNLFTSSDPNVAVVFLIVAIFLPVTLPFFVFACRNKDMGMPPKKQAPRPEPLLTPEAEQNDYSL